MFNKLSGNAFRYFKREDDFYAGTYSYTDTHLGIKAQNIETFLISILLVSSPKRNVNRAT
jgi:hypothetical protein